MASEGCQIFNPAEKVAKISHCSSMEQYKQMYEKSIKEPEAFWGEIAKDFYFEEAVTGKFVDYNFDTTNGKIFIRWLAGAKTNICYNCLDRHVAAGKGDQVAFYWVGNDPADAEEVTYADLLKEVCRLANYLKSKGVAKGDKVAIYMPMIKELVVAMLAVARIGAVPFHCDLVPMPLGVTSCVSPSVISSRHSQYKESKTAEVRTLFLTRSAEWRLKKGSEGLELDMKRGRNLEGIAGDQVPDVDGLGNGVELSCDAQDDAYGVPGVLVMSISLPRALTT
nr:acetyl-coenzyme A synthetase, cytoplasmic-like [Penaeus vannamei]